MKKLFSVFLMMILVMFMGFLIGLKIGISEGREEIMSRLSEDVNLILNMEESGVLEGLEFIHNDSSNDVTNLFHFSKIILRKK